MKKLFLLFSIAFFAVAAQTLTITGPSSITAGNNAPIVISLAGSSGLNISGLQWSLPTSTGVSYGLPVLSSASTTAGKGIWCNSSNSLCLVLGESNATPPVVTNNPLADGAVASFQLSVANTVPPGNLSLPLSGLFSATTGGLNQALSSGTAYTILVLSRCDVNGDGVVNNADVQAMIAALTGRGSCPTSAGCTLQTTIEVIIAALGGACQL